MSDFRATQYCGTKLTVPNFPCAFFIGYNDQKQNLDNIELYMLICAIQTSRTRGNLIRQRRGFRQLTELGRHPGVDVCFRTIDKTRTKPPKYIVTTIAGRF